MTSEPKSAIVRYAYGWSDDRKAAPRELKMIGILIVIVGIVWWFK